MAKHILLKTHLGPSFLVIEAQAEKSDTRVDLVNLAERYRVETDVPWSSSGSFDMASIWRWCICDSGWGGRGHCERSAARMRDGSLRELRET